MKRTIKYALVAVLGAVIISPALAQDNFPDVPENHWAYEALARMKREGLLVGYPDGLYRGGRPASRYEMAVALHSVFLRIKNLTDGLSQQIEAIKGMGTGNPAEIQALKDAIAALQNDVNALKGSDYGDLRRMADTFQKELQSLGVDVEAMKKDLADLQSRVEKLEKSKLPFDVHGDINLLVLGGGSIDDNFGVSTNGVVYGVEKRRGGQPTGGVAGITRDLSILHEGAVTLTSNNETGPKFNATFVIGNMFTGIGNQSSFGGGTTYGEPASDVYINDFTVKFDSSVSTLGFNAELGRVGYMISPYILKRPVASDYYANDRWNDGKWRFDGGIIGLGFGPVKIDIFGGRNSGRLSVNGQEINPMVLGANYGGLGGNTNNNPVVVGNQFQVDRSLGANLNIPLGDRGAVNLAYLILDADNRALALGSSYDRVNVFGGSANFNLGPIRVEGGASQTNWSLGSSNLIDSDNQSYYGKVGYEGKAFNVYGGYRQVDAYYNAPGDWGRLGLINNPVNIKGFMAGIAINIGRELTLTGAAEFDEGASNNFRAVTGFDEDTKIEKYVIGLNFNLNANLGLYASYEDTKFEKVVNYQGFRRPDAKYKWTTVGLNYGLGSNAKLTLQYQYSDVENDYQISSGGTFKGGLLSTQVSFKF